MVCRVEVQGLIHYLFIKDTMSPIVSAICVTEHNMMHLLCLQQSVSPTASVTHHVIRPCPCNPCQGTALEHQSVTLLVVETNHLQ